MAAITAVMVWQYAAGGMSITTNGQQMDGPVVADSREA